MLRRIDFSNSISESALIKELHLSQFDEFLSFSTLAELEGYLDTEIKYLNKYKNADDSAKNIAKRLIASEEYLENKMRDFL